MTFYEINGEYPTSGPGSFQWGDPEDNLQNALDVRGIEVFGFDAGTALGSGHRDVSFEVETDDPDVLTAAFGDLPPDQAKLWEVRTL